MPREPRLISWRWVRKRNEFGRILAPRFHRLRKSGLCSLPKIVTLRMQADQKRKLDRRKPRQQLTVPQPRALGAWRRITAFGAPGITISHGYDRDARRVIKNARVDTHPPSQAFAAWIIPWNPCLVHARARRLSNNQDACSFPSLNNRPWTQREVRLAHAACAHGCQ